MLVEIPEEVAQRLNDLAKEQDSSVGELLTKLLNRYAPENPPGSLVEMAQNARDAGLASKDPIDTSERSREILNTEYADYLKRRMDTDADDDHHG
jgi:hypothetical protein